MDPITLYGAPFSLYTGRTRSYFIKAGIDYREEPHASPHFYESVLPKAGGRRGIPTIEFPDGSVIRDGVAIIDHFERLNGGTFSPSTPKQRIVSRLLDAIGAEGLLRPCMHYRWNFDQDNDEFLRFHFQTIYSGDDVNQAAAERMQFIKEEVNPAWGVTPDNYELIEGLHQGTLQTLNAHFSNHPYFLGGKPCIGDFGMMAPLYGHLGRDPKPLSLMQTQAVRLFRWVERMNRSEPDAGEFANKDYAYLGNDEVPDTLIHALKHFAIDYVPETRAACACINQWLDENADVPVGTEVERGVGMCSFEIQGMPLSTIAQPFRFYVLKRVQDEFDALDGQSRDNAAELLAACDMEEVLDFRLTRGIGRANNLEVWL
ncbi:MAG: glutathione S-transferase N-terminal domain-containing protein [Gammaproteobacteria bacterium]|nr:glutathione S-transferase N-terminal domain-containing protein [Gammaproteobacteria bacterium]